MQESIESRKLRTRLGSYLSKVEEGLSFVVTRNGQPVAELRPVPQIQHAEQTAQAEEQTADSGMPEPIAISGLGLACYHLPPVVVQPAAEVTADAVPAEHDIPSEMNGAALPAAEPTPEDTPVVSAAAPAAKKSRPKAARKKPTGRRTASKTKK